MPSASDSIVHHKTFGQRGPVMRAGRADGEEIIAVPNHQYRLALGVTLQHAAVAKLADRDPLREVRSAQFLFFCHLSAGIPIWILNQDSHRHRPGATKKFHPPAILNLTQLEPHAAGHPAGLSCETA